ncbi:hypothetical protein CALCODRAFT_483315 [Calocera cornea HHB12733]|uniref:N-acetyltransferase domain-containing protein n=1 Tax=Calocera cornea HHB12733 TaxID=1353952 RepID=A0A165FV49_9BASI|nr:hypothetical protein CALCODRAFT_483315 [Calocera cornea HHB12733]
MTAIPTFSDYTYTVSGAIPSTATYRHLRRSGGLSDRSAEACAIGLPRSVFCVQVLADPIPGTSPATDAKRRDGDGIGMEDAEGEQPDPRAVAMGRIIGDGGLFLQVTDIVVLPAHRQRGLAKLVMGELMRWVHAHVPESCYVSLIADGEARRLYAQFGFEETSLGGSVGMALRVAGKGKESA